MDSTQKPIFNFTSYYKDAVQLELQQIQFHPNKTLQPRKIQKENIPVIRDLSWYEVTKKRLFASNLLLGFAIPSAVATVYFRFTARPLEAFKGFGLLTAALTITGLVFRYMTPSKLDPEYRAQEREKALNELDKGIPKFSDLKYEESVISKKEIQILIERDIRSMEYEEFVRKHEVMALSLLDVDNKILLKPKYMQLIQDLYEVKHLPKLTAADASKSLGVTSKELSSLFIHSKVFEMYQENGSFENFIKEIGTENIQYLIHPTYRTWFIGKFQEHVLKEMKEKGTVDAEKVFAEDFKAFGNDVKQGILKTLAYTILSEQTKSGKFDYDTFFSANSIEYLMPMDQNVHDFLAEKYLELPYLIMKKYEKHRRSDFQSNGFLSIALHKEVVDVLFKRFEFLTIQQICENPQTADDFFESIRDKVFLPTKWIDKVLQGVEGLSIREILAISPRIFTCDILNGYTTELVSGKKINEQLQEEISNYNDFMDVANAYPEEVFDKNYFSLNLSHHILEFTKRNVELFLLPSKEHENKYVKTIEKYKLLSPQIIEIFQNTRQTIKQENERHLQSVRQLENQHLEIQGSIRSERDKEIENVKNRYQLEEKASERISILEKSVQKMAEELEQLEVNLKDRKKQQEIDQKEMETLNLQPNKNNSRIEQLNLQISQNTRELNPNNSSSVSSRVKQKIESLKREKEKLSSVILSQKPLQTLESEVEQIGNSSFNKLYKLLSSQKKEKETVEETNKQNHIKIFQECRNFLSQITVT